MLWQDKSLYLTFYLLLDRTKFSCQMSGYSVATSAHQICQICGKVVAKYIWVKRLQWQPIEIVHLQLRFSHWYRKSSRSTHSHIFCTSASIVYHSAHAEMFLKMAGSPHEDTYFFLLCQIPMMFVFHSSSSSCAAELEVGAKDIKKEFCTEIYFLWRICKK